MKPFVIRCSLLVLLFSFIGVIVVFAFYIHFIYLNAEGQKRAICLAQAIVKLHEKEGKLPGDFLQEVGFFFGDRRNVRFDLHIKDESEFKIEYRPHSVWIFQPWKPTEQRLEIRWKKGMREIEVESSIDLP